MAQLSIYCGVLLEQGDIKNLLSFARWLLCCKDYYSSSCSLLDKVNAAYKISLVPFVSGVLVNLPRVGTGEFGWDKWNTQVTDQFAKLKKAGPQTWNEIIDNSRFPNNGRLCILNAAL